MAEEKVRYSDEELAEFKTIIEDMLTKAKAEYNTLRRVVMHNGTNDIEDTSPSFKTVEDDGANTANCHHNCCSQKPQPRHTSKA